MSVEIPFIVNGQKLSTLEITRIHTGCDGTHDYNWRWFIHNHFNGYETEQLDEGVLQHRECDGLFTLAARVLERIRGRKGDK